MSETPGRSKYTTWAVVPLVVAGVIVALVLSQSTTKGHNSGPTSTTQPLPTTTTTTIPFNIHDIARKDVVAQLPCVMNGNEWVFQGIVTNSAKFPRKYQIIFDFVTTLGATDVDTKILEIPVVGPHKTVSWTVKGGKGHSGLSCVVTNVLAVPVN